MKDEGIYISYVFNSGHVRILTPTDPVITASDARRLGYRLIRAADVAGGVPPHLIDGPHASIPIYKPKMGGMKDSRMEDD